MRGMIISLLSAVLSCSDYAMAEGATEPWKRYEEKGKIKTERSYAEMGDLRRIDVVSKCFKEPSSELHFGECSHRVTLSPAGVNLTLNQGEVVFLAAHGEIATYEYGCCGGPGEVLFYDDSGKVIGKTHSYMTPNPSFSTRQNDIGSVLASRYLLVEKNRNQEELNHDEYELIDSQKSDFRQSVKLNVSETIKKKGCGLAPQFAKLTDKQELYIVFDTVECSLRAIKSTCVRKQRAWDCRSLGF
jgi:hypothetical protein